MLSRIIPWKYFLRLAARRYDFLDPISFLARLRSFAQPSEIQEPIELVRAGMIFHARGLLNTKAIQHNLDWIWPYWITRQFNPNDPSFIPRAFSFSHINLTHRNWTAVGQPGSSHYPIVDPRGLLTPLHDGWSVDCWFYGRQGETLFPSQLEQVDQELIDAENRIVKTICRSGHCTLQTSCSMEYESEAEPAAVKLDIGLKAEVDGWLVVALRPFNPEGIQFIESAAKLQDSPGWLVNGETRVLFSETPARMLFSNYDQADVSSRLHQEQSLDSLDCRIGMVSSAAFFPVSSTEQTKTATVSVELPKPEQQSADFFPSWSEAVEPAAILQLPDEKIKSLFDTCVRTLIHLSAADIVPGPYTYKRFWFRDACLMLHPMLTVGLQDICRRQIDQFPRLQKHDGFFHSQAGEWDANGQVLWLYNRYRLLTGGDCNPEWLRAVKRGGHWIASKRVLSDRNEKYHGLLPPGFSAEHFGPNDYYYWDDFWAVAGLQGAAEMLTDSDSDADGRLFRQTATEMLRSLQKSIRAVRREKLLEAIPSSPNRRMDSGAIGVLVADYPLQLYDPADEYITATVEYLMENCLHQGCFFQDMIHSGINIYMTLMLAQVLLRTGDPRYFDLLSGCAKLASPTGQWPEAIHPITGGGCMGDGQHGWAAAEWVMLLRNIFVFEEKNKLVIGRGIRREWLQKKAEISFGPTLTPYGRVSVFIRTEPDIEIKLTADWYSGKRPETVVAIPGFRQQKIDYPEYRCRLEPL